MESYESENGKNCSVYIINSSVLHEMPDNWCTKAVMRFKNKQEVISSVSLMWMNVISDT